MVAHLILKPGDAVVFNNHRALHARDAFKVPNTSSMSRETIISDRHIYPRQHSVFSFPDFQMWCRYGFYLHYSCTSNIVPARA